MQKQTHQKHFHLSLRIGTHTLQAINFETRHPETKLSISIPSIQHLEFKQPQLHFNDTPFMCFIFTGSNQKEQVNSEKKHQKQHAYKKQLQ